MKVEAKKECKRKTFLVTNEKIMKNGIFFGDKFFLF